MSASRAFDRPADDERRDPPGDRAVLGDEGGPPRAVDLSGHGGALASLLDALDEVRGLVDTDVIIRRAIELARDRLGMRRVRIFMLDRSRNLMLGTWGMDPSCAVVDEHQVVYPLCVSDRETLRRSEVGGTHFTVFENCPIVEHQRGATRIAGHGRVAKTPIRSSQTTFGIMCNDAAPVGDRYDEGRQGQVAVLCSVLGTMLDPLRVWRVRSGVPPGSSPSQRLVSGTVEMLDQDPGRGTKEIAAALNISESRLGVVFKALMGISLVDYRNLLRLDRFEALIDRGPGTLMDAALAAGFGSYAQFYRVFRARLQTTPRQYLRTSGGYRAPAPPQDAPPLRSDEPGAIHPMPRALRLAARGAG